MNLDVLFFIETFIEFPPVVGYYQQISIISNSILNIFVHVMTPPIVNSLDKFQTD